VNQALTPEGALFDIVAAKGQVVIWQRRAERTTCRRTRGARTTCRRR
jgi:hypothetical protein